MYTAARAYPDSKLISESPLDTSHDQQESVSGVNLPLTPDPSLGSSVKMVELSFGTVCGICAGVFMKKGVKALAFALGGIFVVLQVSSQCSIGVTTYPL